MFVIETLAWSLFIGMTAAGAVVATRKLPPIERRVFEARRPWACDICMCFWSTLIAWPVTGFLSHLDPTVIQAAPLLAVGPAYPISLLVVRKLSEPIRAPILPPLIDRGTAPNS